MPPIFGETKDSTNRRQYKKIHYFYCCLSLAKPEIITFLLFPKHFLNKKSGASSHKRLHSLYVHSFPFRGLRAGLIYLICAPATLYFLPFFSITTCLPSTYFFTMLALAFSASALALLMPVDGEYGVIGLSVRVTLML